MITRSDPMRDTLSLRRAMDQLFEQSFVNSGLLSGSSSLMAPLDVYETPQGYEVDVALPEVRPEDIELTVDMNSLTIRGHYSHQEGHQSRLQDQVQREQQSQQGRTQPSRHGHNWLVQEIPSGAFERTMTFPRSIDNNAIQTQFVNGMLTVMLPVSEASRPKRVEITRGQSQQQQVGVGTRQR